MKKFYPHAEPFKPTAPQKEYNQLVELSRITVYSYDTIEIPHVADATHLSIEIKDGYDDRYAELIFSKYKMGKNPYYAQQCKRYEDDLATYKKEKEEWDVLKEAYDKDQAIKSEKHERQLYKKLKKKFKDED